MFILRNWIRLYRLILKKLYTVFSKGMVVICKVAFLAVRSRVLLSEMNAMSLYRPNEVRPFEIIHWDNNLVSFLLAELPQSCMGCPVFYESKRGSSVSDTVCGIDIIKVCLKFLPSFSRIRLNFYSTRRDRKLTLNFIELNSFKLSNLKF